MAKFKDISMEDSEEFFFLVFKVTSILDRITESSFLDDKSELKNKIKIFSKELNTQTGFKPPNKW